MKKLRFLILLALLLISTAQPGFCSNKPTKPPAIQRMQYMVVPEGIFLKAIMQSEVSTKTNNLGDPIRAIIPTNFYMMDTICLPQNSILEGEITEFALAKKGKDALMRLHFNKITFPDGTTYALDANLWNDGSDIIGGGVSDLMETREVPFSVGGLSPGYILIKPTGEYKIGKDVTLSAGSEVIIKTNQEIKINFLE